MRHGKKINHLGRTASHRDAMLSNMASSLILHKRITTTLAKAKALRKYVEPLLSKAKDNTTHSRRVVFSELQNKESVHELFSVVADKIATRPGGYTRILKTGSRLGDSSEMCIMELVDFNDLMLKEAAPKKSRRSRRGTKSSADSASQATIAAKTEAKVDTDTSESKSDDTPANPTEEINGADEQPKA